MNDKLLAMATVYAGAYQAARRALKVEGFAQMEAQEAVENFMQQFGGDE